MSTATPISKGQTTAPQEIRHYLGLHTGDKLGFLIESDGRVFLAVHTVDVKELKGSLPKPKKKVSIAQMNKAIAKRRRFHIHEAGILWKPFYGYKNEGADFADHYIGSLNMQYECQQTFTFDKKAARLKYFKLLCD